MPFLAGLLAAASVVCVFAAASVRTDPFVSALFPTASRRAGPIVPSLVRRIGGSSVVQRLARAEAMTERLRAAGWKASVEDVMATKIGAAVALTAIVAALVPGVAPLALVVGAGAFLAPDLIVARAARARVRRSDAEVVQFLDLLAASSSAGLSAPAAIRRAASGVRGPLADELSSSSAAVDIGGRWREELRAIGVRLHLPDLRSTAAALARTESLGSSLADAMRHLAEEVRESRRARAGERARTAPVKMLFPLVCMILPAFLLLTVVPVLIATLRSLR
jgi:tight adherence protein C